MSQQLLHHLCHKNSYNQGPSKATLTQDDDKVDMST